MRIFISRLALIALLLGHYSLVLAGEEKCPSQTKFIESIQNFVQYSRPTLPTLEAHTKNSNEAAEHFVRLDCQTRADILSHFKAYSDAFSQLTIGQKDRPLNTKEFLRLTLANLKLHISESDYDYIVDDKLVEAYFFTHNNPSDVLQFFRNAIFFNDITSYSLYDILSDTPKNLYDRDPSVTQKIIDSVGRVIQTRSTLSMTEADVPKALLYEIRADKRANWVTFEAIMPIFSNSDHSIVGIVAVEAVEKADLDSIDWTKIDHIPPGIREQYIPR